MPRCSVCQTRYTASKSEFCPICGWDLQPYSLVIGMIPEVSHKEKQRLEWAQAMWLKLQPQQEQIAQLKLQLEAIAQTTAALRTQLDLAKQEQHRLEDLLQARETAELQQLQQLQQAKAEVGNLQAQLDHLQAQLDQTLSQTLDAQPAPERSTDSALSPSASLSSASPSHSTSPAASLEAVFSASRAVAIVPPPLPGYALTVENILLNKQGELLQTVPQTLFCHRETIAGETFELMAIAGGGFWMGSPDAELGRDTHESPRRWVTIAPFLMSRLLVTQAQWRAIAQLENIQRPLDPDPSHFKGDSLPVERVSWLDAVEFCARLSRAAGRSYRLPSEAEWEYACRAGTETPFHLGETLNAEFVNYDGNDIYGDGSPGQYRQSTTPVGTLAANRFGLADMHGNVWEWCEDPWHDDYQDAPLNGSVWQQGGIENHRVLRGGAWYCLPELCRSAQRHWDEVSHSGSGIGFRIVGSIVPHTNFP